MYIVFMIADTVNRHQINIAPCQTTQDKPLNVAKIIQLSNRNKINMRM